MVFFYFEDYAVNNNFSNRFLAFYRHTYRHKGVFLLLELGEVHQRTPLFIGNKDDVEAVTTLLRAGS